jgi:hypothetical protein
VLERQRRIAAVLTGGSLLREQDKATLKTCGELAKASLAETAAALRACVRRRDEVRAMLRAADNDAADDAAAVVDAERAAEAVRRSAQGGAVARTKHRKRGRGDAVTSEWLAAAVDRDGQLPSPPLTDEERQ